MVIAHVLSKNPISIRTSQHVKQNTNHRRHSSISSCCRLNDNAVTISVSEE
jgi:hypothetical protein